MYSNSFRLEFDANSINEGFARVAVAAFASQLNPTLEEINDIKTAVSEAVTNAIIHGYDGEKGTVVVRSFLKEDSIEIQVEDKGRGIENIEQAMEPMFTTRPMEERSGMGFVFMEIFMDELDVKSEKGVGTTVTMKKIISKNGA